MRGGSFRHDVKHSTFPEYDQWHFAQIRVAYFAARRYALFILSGSKMKGLPMSPPPRKTILLMLWTTHQHPMRAARGAHRLLQEQGRFDSLLMRADSDGLEQVLSAQDRSFAGVIGFLPTEKSERAVVSHGLPAVNVSARLPEQGRPIPRVIPDNYAVGQLAAEHFIHLGFKHLAYTGVSTWYSRQRGGGFVERLRADGLTPVCAEKLRGEEIARWLESLPRPLAVLAGTDFEALRVVHAARSLALRVPEDVAVIGVDNTELVCELADVPLSSVDTAGEEVGHRAAELLTAMIDGASPPEESILVPPLRLVTRESTATIAVKDPLLERALCHIREHACDPIDVSDVVEITGIPRRTLERQTRSHLGHSPHQEIRRVQFARAKQLLAQTRLPTREVSRRCGFGDVRSFLRAFGREFGCTPTEFRERSG
jgi:LacI family transcriptional regulator